MSEVLHDDISGGPVPCRSTASVCLSDQILEYSSEENVSGSDKAADFHTFEAPVGEAAGVKVVVEAGRRTRDPVIRSPARYRWTTAPAFTMLRSFWSAPRALCDMHPESSRMSEFTIYCISTIIQVSNNIKTKLNKSTLHCLVSPGAICKIFWQNFVSIHRYTGMERVKLRCTRCY